jgi:hypothetical protein
MLVTNHVLSGAVLGSLIASPPAAFVAGVASHFALDALPHWGVAEGEDFLEVAVRDGLSGLAAIGVLAALSAPDRRWPVLFGMAGAAFPDLDKPALLFFGRSPFPAYVDRFHSVIQREAPHRMRHEVVVGVVGAALAAGLVRRRSATS